MNDTSAPFAVGDIVETIKGAKFWGEVVSVYEIPSISEEGYRIVGPQWRADVRAVAADFLGTIHVYPTAQLSLRVGGHDAAVALWDCIALLDGIAEAAETGGDVMLAMMAANMHRSLAVPPTGAVSHG